MHARRPIVSIGQAPADLASDRRRGNVNATERPALQSPLGLELELSRSPSLCYFPNFGLCVTVSFPSLPHFTSRKRVTRLEWSTPSTSLSYAVLAAEVAGVESKVPAPVFLFSALNFSSPLKYLLFS